jgi:DNA topoisomerase-1
MNKEGNTRLLFTGSLVGYPKGQGRLAQLAQGQRVRPKQIRARQESGLTEYGLLRALCEQGIGRPATYAGIVDTLLGRKYVERRPEGTLRLTKRGRAVLDFLTGRYPALFAPAFTAEAEQLLDEVAAGRLEYEETVEQVWTKVVEEK